jgi:pyruvate/2-oxoglutarate dehydrogenase complex dihydrolipoamide acyltransferase (E2) component
MIATTPILLERDNVNDESVVLVCWHIEHGGKVAAETLLAEVETSKANVEVYASVEGYLQWAFPAGADVPVSSPIGYISTEPLTGGALRAPTKSSAGNSTAGSMSNGTLAVPTATPLGPVALVVDTSGAAFVFASPRQRISRLAAKMMEEHGLTAGQFAGKFLIRKQDVLDLLNPPAPKPPAVMAQQASALPAAAITQPYTEVPLSKMKRFEGAALAAGVRNAVSSAVVVTCFTRGLRKNLKNHPVETGNLSAVIVYEVSRLLRKYPVLNATHRKGVMLQYDQVNLGFALDDGRGLKVAVFHDADQMSLQQVADELLALTTAYVQNKLTPTQISNATFTISDLSGLGVSDFYPIISENQSGILGVSGEQFAPGSEYGFYTMNLTFDHQLSDGRTAARFLNDLKKRLQVYEEATLAAI